MDAVPSHPVVRPTIFVEAPRLASRLGLDLLIASETFQVSGSFKFRAAYNLAAGISAGHILTASSGNFGQALAKACTMLGKACTVVMPDSSAAVKIDAVRENGGQVDLLDVRVKSRAARVGELALENPSAYVASAYDDPLVIQGNASLGLEIGALGERIDAVVAPVGGGGLTSGLVVGLQACGSTAKVVGAEPLMANDAARSLRAGEIVRNGGEPSTIADGARTVSLGKHNWPILRDGLETIVEVPESAICEGLRLLFLLANLKAEPTGALGIGAILARPDVFEGRRICCVVSGGNVDPAVYARILSSA